jgi:hypothetical protein
MDLLIVNTNLQSYLAVAQEKGTCMPGSTTALKHIFVALSKSSGKHSSLKEHLCDFSSIRTAILITHRSYLYEKDKKKAIALSSVSGRKLSEGTM